MIYSKPIVKESMLDSDHKKSSIGDVLQLCKYRTQLSRKPGAIRCDVLQNSQSIRYLSESS